MTTAVDTVNSSGYPFQLAVEQIVRTRCKGGWHVEAAEFPWSGGFIDLVLRAGPLVGIVECKRVKEQSWIFLVRPEDSDNLPGARLTWYNGPLVGLRPKDPASARLMCTEFWMSEGSSESAYCVIPKRPNSRTEILEDIARPLVEASRELIGRERYEDGHGYEVAIPILVTTARLQVMRVDAGSISPSDGMIPVTSGTTCDAGFVRFRKTLVNHHSAFNVQYGAVAKMASDRERSVFVVNVDSLERFLHGFRAFGVAGKENQSYPDEFIDPNRVVSVVFH